MNTAIQKRFEIRKTERIANIIKKYENYAQDFLLSEEEEHIIAVSKHLSQWERCVLYVLAEVKSTRSFALFFGISHFKACKTITDIKDKVKYILKNTELLSPPKQCKKEVIVIDKGIMVVNKESKEITITPDLKTASELLNLTYERTRQILNKTDGNSQKYIIKKVSKKEDINLYLKDFTYVSYNA